jgi:hypothetical protein
MTLLDHRDIMTGIVIHNKALSQPGIDTSNPTLSYSAVTSVVKPINVAVEQQGAGSSHN